MTFTTVSYFADFQIHERQNSFTRWFLKHCGTATEISATKSWKCSKRLRRWQRPNRPERKAAYPALQTGADSGTIKESRNWSDWKAHAGSTVSDP